MELFYRITSLLGGLALFLYGMRIMGDGLKSSSGGAMKAALEKVTDHPVKGFVLGMLVTCMIQSSTATIVLTVGLVGAGFLTFRQSTGIVLGANVGTAITAQIIRLMDVDAGAGSLVSLFKADHLAPLALIAGIILLMFVHKEAASPTGTICMGFGILFVGLMNMSSAVSSLGDSLSGLLTRFEGNYVLGFLSGVLVTGLIQSSSAVVGILQSLASSVGIRFCAVFAVIIGVNIGDCLTTYLVCRIGASAKQRRTCLVHIIYNVFAALLLCVGIFVLRMTGVLNDDLWYAMLRSGGVANVHGLFRLIPAVLLLPFVGTFAQLAEKICPDTSEKEDDEARECLRELDMHLIQNPGLALEESGRLIERMGVVASHNVQAAMNQIFAYDPERDARIARRENVLDQMADSSNRYIVAVSPYIKLEKDRRMQSFQYKALICYERIGDLAVNINGSVRGMRENGSGFSDLAVEELKVLYSAVDNILQLVMQAVRESNPVLAKDVEPLEEVIDALTETIRDRHMQRMVNGSCEVESGVVFQNIILHMERIADQCSDLAVYLIGRNDEKVYGREHQYIHNMHQSEDRHYRQQFDWQYERFFSQLA